MATREISIEDAIKTLRNIVAPPRQVEEEYSEEDEYFQGLRDGLKGKTKNRNKKKKNKSGQSKKGSLNNNTNNDKNPMYVQEELVYQNMEVAIFWYKR